MSPVQLTVITPSLNHGRYIGAAIDSVRLSPSISYEHIVVDGGSTDETHAVLAERPHLTVHVDPALDSHEAINHALTLAKGEVIGFLNCDDRYDPGALDDVLAIFAAHPDVQSVCGTMRFFADDDGVEEEINRFTHLEGDDLALELTFGNPGFNSWFFRRGLLEQLGGCRTYFRFAADRDLLLRAYAIATPVNLPRLVYHYRVHRGSRTMDPRGTNREAMIVDHLRLVREQAEQTWGHDRRLLSLLADWNALERLKLFVRATKYKRPIVGSFLAVPWCRIPRALGLRRRWLKILLPRGN